MSIKKAIEIAEKILPGEAALEGENDPRWQAIIAVSVHITTDPEAVWSFIKKWGRHKDEDLRMAVATCLLEHLLENNAKAVIDEIEDLARTNPEFAETVSYCSRLGEATDRSIAERLDRIIEETTR